MKVVNVGINLAPCRGGIYRTVVSFSRAFRRCNYEAIVLGFGPPRGPTEFECPSICIETTRIPVLSKYYVWPGFYDGRFERLLGRPDVVFIHGLFYHAAIRTACYCARRKIPYIVVSHGSLDPYVFTYRRMRKQVWTTLNRKRLCVDPSAVLFSTAEEALRAASWTTGGRTEIIPWPVLSVPDYDKHRARAAILKKYELPPQTKVAVFCGRLDPVKRPLEAIRAFKAVAEKDWVLLIVGPATEALPERAVEAACGEPGPRCIWAGPAYGQQLNEHFRAADLLIVWSHKENFSHVTAEALACGVPAFLSRGVNLWRELAPVGCAFQPSRDGPEEGALRSALSEVLRMNREELAEAGQRGRDWAREELSEERFAQRVSRLCVTALANNQ